jgi:hypothetical protein
MIQSSNRARRLIPLLAVVFIGAIGAGTACHSKASGGELELTAAAEPGANAFMPPAASPPPTGTQPPPTLQAQGDGNTVETAPVHGDHEGLYGDTVNNTEVDRDKIADFLSANPAQANSFVESLNSDTTTYWSGGNHLTVADVPRYLHELTPVVLRLDTRLTDHGFGGTHSIARQSVFQAGNAVLVDARGVPRVRGLSGNPLTAPIPLKGAPNLLGTTWPGYRPGGLARIEAAAAAITNFVLVDVVTGLAFNRPVGTIGTNDTPHTQPVAAPEPDSIASGTSAAPTNGQDPLSDIDGTYTWHHQSSSSGGPVQDDGSTFVVTHQGNTVTLDGHTMTANADGSFSRHDTYNGDYTYVFANEGGRPVVHLKTQNQYGWVQWLGVKQ